MNSFERDIQNHNQLQKSIVESLTGQNEYQDIIDCLVKAGVAEEDMIEKAKYIRREGTPGNYKYIYEEPKVKVGQTISIGKRGIKYKIKDVKEGIATLEALEGQDLGNSNKEQKVKVEHLSSYGTFHKEQQSEKKDSTQNKDLQKLEVGQKYHSPATDGGEAIDWTITSIKDGKYTIETYNKEGRKGSHTFDEKTLRELINESKPKK